MYFLLCIIASIILVFNLNSADADAKLKQRQLLVDDDNSDDLTAPPPLNFNVLGDTEDTFFSQALSSLVALSDHPNPDIFTEADPPQSSTTCVGQEMPLNWGQSSSLSLSLIVRNDLCPQQQHPLSPETLQLFGGDPMGTINRILLPQNSGGGGGSSTTNKDNPTRFLNNNNPEEQEESNMSPGAEADIDYEVWQDYTGEVTYQRPNPCEIQKLAGFPLALCCDGPFWPDDDSYVFLVDYSWVKDCDSHDGRFFFFDMKRIFSLPFFHFCIFPFFR